MLLLLLRPRLRPRCRRFSPGPATSPPPPPPEPPPSASRKLSSWPPALAVPPGLRRHRPGRPPPCPRRWLSSSPALKWPSPTTPRASGLPAAAASAHPALPDYDPGPERSDRQQQPPRPDPYPPSRPHPHSRPHPSQSAPPHPPDRPHPAARPRALHRYHPTRKQHVVVKAQSLGVRVLGRPATAMVMRDLGPGRRTSQPAAPQPESEPIEPRESLIRALGDAYEHPRRLSSEPELEEAMANVEELRPPPAGRVLAESKYRALAHTLLDGFTIQQLHHYIHLHLQRVPAAADPDAARPEAPRHEWILEQLAWVPTTSLEHRLSLDPADALGSSAAATTTTGPVATGPLSPKEKLVSFLMNRCWCLQTEEAIMTAHGRLDITVGDRILSLLLRGRRPLLYQITETLLDHPADRVDIAKSGRRITVHTTKAKAETALDVLDRAVRRMRMVTVAVPASVDRLEDADLDELGRITNTVVSYDGDAAARIAWVHDEAAPPGLETPEQVAVRLMWAAVRQDKTTSTRLLSVPPSFSPKHGARFSTVIGPNLGAQAGDQDNINTAGWQDRLYEWSRWVVPANRIDPDDEAAKAQARKDRRRRLRRHDLLPAQIRIATQAKAVVPTPLGERAPSASEAWRDLETVTTACFGHVVHRSPRPPSPPPPSASGQDTPLLLPLTAKSRLPRILSPVAPPPTAFTSATWGLSLADVPVATSIVLQFRVDPRLMEQKRQIRFPLLELVIQLPRPGQGKLEWDSVEKRLFAVTAVHHADVMLPDCPVDVRVTQLTRAEASPDGLAAQLPLRDFFGRCLLSPQEGRLLTPAADDTRITLPPTLLRGSRRTADQAVPYAFAGLEVRQSAETRWASESPHHHNHRLCYASVEAGRHGGRRADLLLIAGGADPGADLQAHAESYLDTVQAVARGDEFSWF